MSYIPYNPCDDCKQKNKLCNKCVLTNLEINYHRALNEVVKLNNEQGKKITILV